MRRDSFKSNICKCFILSLKKMKNNKWRFEKLIFFFTKRKWRIFFFSLNLRQKKNQPPLVSYRRRRTLNHQQKPSFEISKFEKIVIKEISNLIPRKVIVLIKDWWKVVPNDKQRLLCPKKHSESSKAESVLIETSEGTPKMRLRNVFIKIKRENQRIHKKFF